MNSDEIKQIETIHDHLDLMPCAMHLIKHLAIMIQLTTPLQA